jgi:hypothetical protein
MLDVALMKSVAEQLLSQAEVEVAGERLRVTRVGRGSLRVVRFTLNGRDCEAIEQNPERPSRWGQLARAGHKVVQFKDVASNRYIGVAVDGQVKEYGR